MFTLLFRTCSVFAWSAKQKQSALLSIWLCDRLFQKARLVCCFVHFDFSFLSLSHDHLSPLPPCFSCLFAAAVVSRFPQNTKKHQKRTNTAHWCPFCCVADISTNHKKIRPVCFFVQCCMSSSPSPRAFWWFRCFSRFIVLFLRTALVCPASMDIKR